MSEAEFTAAATPNLRIKRDLLEKVRDAGKLPVVAAFSDFCRNHLHYKGSFERKYPFLIEGRGVPFILARAFIEYLRHKQKRDVTVETGCEPYPEDESADTDGVWRGTDTAFRSLTAKHRDCDEMYFSRPGEQMPGVARQIMRSVGYLNAPPGCPFDEEACVERGEGIMQRTASDYSSWLSGMVAADRRTVMAITVGERHHPVGVSVMAPVSRDAAGRLMGGSLLDKELTGGDFQNPSKYVFWHMLTEPTPPLAFDIGVVTAAQLHTCCYQLAYFTRGCESPFLIAIAGSPRYEGRLRTHGFVETGHCMRGTVKKMMVVAPPNEFGASSDDRWRSYYWWTGTGLAMYRAANGALWQAEDRLRLS